MAESVPVEDIYTGDKSKAVRYFKAKVLDTHLSKKINRAVQQAIDNEVLFLATKAVRVLTLPTLWDCILLRNPMRRPPKEH